LKCSRCGLDNPDSSMYCGRCGQPLMIQYRESRTVRLERSWWGGKLCPRCGLINGIFNMRCQACKQSLNESEIANVIPYDQTTRAKVHRRYTLKVLAIVPIVLITLVLIFAILPTNASYFQVTVHSTHLTQTVHFQILINGNEVQEGDITAGNTYFLTIPYKFPWMFTGQQSIVIKGISYGDGLGDTTDSQSLTVVNGMSYSVTLNI
jgi:ribosomal protein S27AE